MSRLVEVPDGCRAVIVSEQLVERYQDWTLLQPCECRAVTEDDGTVDVETRYVDALNPAAGDVLLLRVAEHKHSVQMEARELSRRTGALVVVVGPGESIEQLDEDGMLSFGWIRTENT